METADKIQKTDENAMIAEQYFKSAEEHHKNKQFDACLQLIKKGLEVEENKLPVLQIFDEILSNSRTLTFIIPKPQTYSKAMVLDGMSFYSFLIWGTIEYLFSKKRINIILSCNNINYLADLGEGLLVKLKQKAKELKGDLKCINVHKINFEVAELFKEAGNEYPELYHTSIEAVEAFLKQWQ